MVDGVECDLNKKKVICERLKRQGFVNPLVDSEDTEAYKQLFRLLQPVAPVFNSRPGNPASVGAQNCI